MSPADFDFISFTENQEISPRPGKDAPLDSGYMGLVSILHSLGTAFPDDETIDFQWFTLILSFRKIHEPEITEEKQPKEKFPSQPSEKRWKLAFPVAGSSVD